MRLTELKPEWDESKKFIRFDCPKCRMDGIEGNVARLDIQVVRIEPDDRPCWNMTGSTFEDISTQPSIRFQHWNGKKDTSGANCDAHFFITAGEIRFV